MFERDDEKYLLRNLGQNAVVLFLGAGASRDAKNLRGDFIPLGSELAAELFSLIYPDEVYDGTSLAEVYGAALTIGMPLSILRNFLEERLLCSFVPEKYKVLSRIFWYRVYTANIDDLLHYVYLESEIRPDVLTFPSDDVLERDQILAKIQHIYLHGRLPCDPRHVIFSSQQYARGTVSPQPLYEEFIRDYSFRPVVFVGTHTSVRFICCLPPVRPALTVVSGDSGVSTI